MRKFLSVIFCLFICSSIILISNNISSDAKTILPTTKVERITAVNRYNSIEQIDIIFDTATDVSIGENGNFVNVGEQVNSFIKINDYTLAEIIANNKDIKNSVQAHWWTSLNGQRQLNICLSSALKAKYLFKTDGGDIVSILPNLIIPEGKIVETRTLTYNLDKRVWNHGQNNLNVDGITIQQQTGYVDYNIYFNHSSDVMIDNAFMLTLGGLYNDPSNGASPIYLQDNVNFGYLFNDIVIGDTSIKGNTNIQLWWFGNYTSNRILILRIFDTSTQKLTENTILTLKKGIHTPEEVTSNVDIKFTVTNGTLKNDDKNDVEFYKGTNITTGSLGTAFDEAGYAHAHSFSLFFNMSTINADNLHLYPNVADNLLINGKSFTDLNNGHSAKGYDVLVNLASGYNSSKLIFTVFCSHDNYVDPFNFDGTDKITIKKEINLFGKSILNDIEITNLGTNDLNSWITKNELLNIQNIIDEINKIDELTSKETLLNLNKKINDLSDYRQSLITNKNKLDSAIATISDKEVVEKDFDILQIEFAVGNTSEFVSEDITLVKAGVNGSSIEWRSSNSSLISNLGKVNKPMGLTSENHVILTATITKGAITKEKTFNLTVSQIPFKAILNLKNNQENEIIIENSNGKIVKPINPIKTGYIFSGWSTKEDEMVEYNFDTILSSDINLYAIYKINEFSITYDLLNGLNSNKNPASYNMLSEDITLENPTKLGYNFIGWYTDSLYNDKIIKIISGTSGNLIIYARWELIVFKINYELDGGINDKENKSSFSAESGKLVLKDATKEGYSFDGWYLDSEYVNKITEIDKSKLNDVTLYAKFSLNDTPIKDKGCGVVSFNNPNNLGGFITISVVLFFLSINLKKTDKKKLNKLN